MSPDPDKPVVALYLRYYLSPSETFVYRQLKGVSDAFTPIVLASETSNLDLFPDRARVREGKGSCGKAGTRLFRMASGSYSVVTPGHSSLLEKSARKTNARGSSTPTSAISDWTSCRLRASLGFPSS